MSCRRGFGPHRRKKKKNCQDECASQHADIVISQKNKKLVGRAQKALNLRVNHCEELDQCQGNFFFSKK